MLPFWILIHASFYLYPRVCSLYTPQEEAKVPFITRWQCLSTVQATCNFYVTRVAILQWTLFFKHQRILIFKSCLNNLITINWSKTSVLFRYLLRYTSAFQCSLYSGHVLYHRVLHDSGDINGRSCEALQLLILFRQQISRAAKQQS
jgi:hypothetical protein